MVKLFFQCLFFLFLYVELINAQQLDESVFFSVEKLKIEGKYDILKAWKPLNISKNENNIISYLIYLKHRQYSYVDSLLIDYKLPSSFAYLPMVSTGYQVDYSSSYGGKGVWGLTYLQGLHNGLVMNRYVDERKNSKKATIAAMKELKRLMDLYQDERWTIFAFMTSPAMVYNTRKKSNSDKWDMCKEQIEVKNLNAMSLINRLQAFESENKKIELDYTPKINNSKQEEIVLTNPIFFDAIYDFNVFDLQDFSSNNPIFINNVLPSNYPIFLSKDEKVKFNQFKQEIYAFQDSMINELFKPKTKNTQQIHIVVTGDVLGIIAEKYNVSVKEIIKWNNLKNTIIYLNQQLKIFPEDNTVNYNYYTVQEGDCFWKIAEKQSNISVKEICYYNNYHTIKSGKKLKLIKK